MYNLSPIQSSACRPASYMNRSFPSVAACLGLCWHIASLLGAHWVTLGKAHLGGLVTYTDTKSTSNLATTARHMLLLLDNRYSSCQKIYIILLCKAPVRGFTHNQLTADFSTHFKIIKTAMIFFQNSEFPGRWWQTKINHIKPVQIPNECLCALQAYIWHTDAGVRTAAPSLTPVTPTLSL